MPGQDGLAAGRELRAKSAIPVLMLTALGEPIERTVGLEVGADDYDERRKLADTFSP